MGTTIAFHYCGKSLKEVVVIGEPKPCCPGSVMPMGCCHDEKVEIQSDDFKVAQQLVAIDFIPALIGEFTFPILDFTAQFKQAQASLFFSQDHSHPPAPPDIILFVQSFLI
jgi:hypothetical protein